MPAPPPVASSPSAPSTPAKSGGPAALPRRTSDETGPVFLDEEDGSDAGNAARAGAVRVPGAEDKTEGRPGGSGPSDGDDGYGGQDGNGARPGATAAQDPGSGQRPAGQRDGAALPELPSRTPEAAPAPTWQADPARQAGFGPPGSGDPRSGDPRGNDPRGGAPRGGDPRGDWGNDAPADPPPAQGGREHTVGLRRSEVLRDPGSAGQVPAQGSPASTPSPGGQAQPGQRVPGQGQHGSGASPEEGQGRQVPAQGQGQGQGQGRPGGAPAPGQQQGPGGVPAQGRALPGDSAPAQGPQAAGGVPAQAAPTSPTPPASPTTAAAPSPGPGDTAAPQSSPLPAASPAQGALPPASPSPVAPGQAAPAQNQAPASGAAPEAGLPGGQPSWSQQPGGLSGGTGLPGSAQSGGPESVVPWRPPANDPFAQLAAARQARPAGLGRRLGARLVDLVLTLAVGAGITFPFVSKVTDHIDAKVDAVEQAGETKQVWLLDGTTGGYLALVIGVLLVFGLLYEVLPTARWGHTLGKRLFGLSVADIESHDKPAFGKAFLRWLVYGVLGVLVVGVVNLAWCLFDRPWRQCWHDKVAGTFVAKRGAGGAGR